MKQINNPRRIFISIPSGTKEMTFSFLFLTLSSRYKETRLTGETCARRPDHFHGFGSHPLRFVLVIESSEEETVVTLHKMMGKNVQLESSRT